MIQLTPNMGQLPFFREVIFLYLYRCFLTSVDKLKMTQLTPHDSTKRDLVFFNGAISIHCVQWPKIAMDSNSTLTR